MRFVMINLILVCLLLFGIGYLAFGNVETDPNPNRMLTPPFTVQMSLLWTEFLGTSRELHKTGQSRVQL